MAGVDGLNHANETGPDGENLEMIESLESLNEVILVDLVHLGPQPIVINLRARIGPQIAHQPALICFLAHVHHC